MKDFGETSASALNALKRKKSNLAFAFFCMEPDRARDMNILYAFCRLMDDIADDATASREEKVKSLTRWKDEISSIYGAGGGKSPLGAELADLVKRRGIPVRHFQDIIDGVMRDTCPAKFENFEDIRKYCYGVASAVGLASIYVFGFKNPRTQLFAETLGYALQFTNILRDVVDDWRSYKRVYIPDSELKAFGVAPEMLGNPRGNPACKRLFAFMYFRAKHFFGKARRLLPLEDKRSMAPALVMQSVYEEILDGLKARNFDIPAKPLKISKIRKIRIAAKALKESKLDAGEEPLRGKVVVAGAGIAGMCAATNLALRGFDVDVYEGSSRTGGRVSSVEWESARLDNGTHAAMGCYDNLSGILKIFSTDVSEYFERVDGITFAYPDGEKIALKFPPKNAGVLGRISSLLSYGRLKGFFSAGNVKLLLKIKLGRNPPPLSGERAKNYLERTGVRNAPDFWTAFCVSALNTPLEDASAELLIKTLKKTVLSGGESAILYLPKKPVAEAFKYLPVYLDGIGSKLHLNEKVTGIEFGETGISGIRTNKSGLLRCDHFVSALPCGVLGSLLPESSALRKRILSIGTSDILNIYFTTDERLTDENCTYLADSPVHWIFDHSKKTTDRGHKLFLYGATISAAKTPLNKESAKRLLETELRKFFGFSGVREVLPAFFTGATISADPGSENARISDAQLRTTYYAETLPNAEFPLRTDNFHVCGDWIQSDLPCTMESAAKSAADLRL